MWRRFFSMTIVGLIAGVTVGPAAPAAGWKIGTELDGVAQRGGLEIDPNGLAQNGGLEIDPNGLTRRGGLDIEPNG